MEKKTAIVLGGTVPHAALIDKLKDRGYYTILVDYFDDPPAAKHCDLHLKDSAMDPEAVIRIAKEHEASLILSPCLDQQMVIAVNALEQLGLYAPFDLDTVYKVTNKELMKKIMWENDIPTSKFIIVESPEQADTEGMELPLIVKPADSNGAAGVSIIRNDDKDKISKAIENAKHWSRNGKVVVEEFVTGAEVSVYNFISEGRSNILLTAQRVSSIEEGKSIKCFCSIAPAQVSEKAKEEMQIIGDKIAKAFALDNTPMFYQCIVSGDKVSVIEFSPRMGGGLCFRTVPMYSGFDYLEAAIDSWEGKKVSAEKVSGGKNYLIHQIHGKPCTFDRLQGVEEMTGQGVIDEIHLHKWQGAEISDEKSSSARVAAFISSDEDLYKLPDKAKKAVENIRVIDNEGNDMSMDDLYLKKEMISKVE